MGPEYFWWGGWWIFPILMPIVMLTVMLLFFYAVFGRGLFRPPWADPDRRYGSGAPPEPPLDILKRRYAKGEITKEQFEQMKREVAA